MYDADPCINMAVFGPLAYTASISINPFRSEMLVDKCHVDKAIELLK